MNFDIRERKINFSEKITGFGDKKEKVKKQNKDILLRVDELFGQIEYNRNKEQESDRVFPIIDNIQRRQFQYSKYRTEVLSNSCNKDNLVLTKVLSSMPLYKQEKIYELKKQGLREFFEKQLNNTKNLKLQQQVKKKDSQIDEQTKLICDYKQLDTSQVQSDSELVIRAGLRMRSPDETITFLKNHFGVIVRSPQKSKLKSRKELDYEERQMEKDRRKLYNVKDKLEIYYTTLEGVNPIIKRKQEEQQQLLNQSQILDYSKSSDITPMNDKEGRNSIFNRNQYYVDHYNNIKIGNNNMKDMKMRSTFYKSHLANDLND
ncbi:unnamed protein product [Paramecium octaurelia]|uniref:Uncharacterized protein n=1 Tax=Paramecium octaurelia TaxID=43137 RepID=A0A8S1V605_PAROT|nr:unnamed protein product [Paramecium octaurelia]